MRIAIVGSGIAGLGAAWLLAREHEVTVFEANAHIGGHTHTHDIELGGQHYRVDSGFIVCNPDHYPHFFRMMNTGTHKLFEHAGLPFHVMVQKFGTQGVPMLDVQTTFKSPARFGDKVALESEITEFREKTFLVRHVMKNGDRTVFEAREVRVWAALDTSAPNGIRALPIPQEIKSMFGQ